MSTPAEESEPLVLSETHCPSVSIPHCHRPSVRQQSAEVNRPERVGYLVVMQQHVEAVVARARHAADIAVVPGARVGRAVAVRLDAADIGVVRAAATGGRGPAHERREIDCEDEEPPRGFKLMIRIYTRLLGAATQFQLDYAANIQP